MSFLDLFRRKKQIDSKESNLLTSFGKQFSALLSKDSYIAVSDYQSLLRDYKELFNVFSTLRDTQVLSEFCEKSGMATSRAYDFLSCYSAMNGHKYEPIEEHNEAFIKRHLNQDREYLDRILNQVDPAILLDEEQRKVVLSDEDYSLVIAGAGAGKTTTVAAKVKYLTEKRNVSPKEILVISFTNKAVDELKSRINSSLGIACKISTFHKAGFELLSDSTSERLKIEEQGFMYEVINNYLKKSILEDRSLVDKLVLFFGSYFDAPFEGESINDFFNYIAKADFSTMRGNISDYSEKIIKSRKSKKRSIKLELLRSNQEVRIANFLYMNGIEYVYEKPYKYNIRDAHKPYTPDFTIMQGNRVAYIEHFGISEDGTNNRYSQEQLDKYKKAVNDKVGLHKEHGTELIYTFSSYKDGRDLLEHLSESLHKKGFILRPRSTHELFDKIISTEENKYISRLVKLICTFLHNFKTFDLDKSKFGCFISETRNERTKLFLTICERCYLEYEKKLKEKNAIDFEDMINKSARRLREAQESGRTLGYKYIIVDEYQDISRQRFNLAFELSKLCNAKIVAVGDDWQSIYAYAGSDITLFTDFISTFGYGKQLIINKTYRNAQELIDIAGGFIQKNCSQIHKQLISPKHIDRPVIICSYSEDDKKDQKGGSFQLVGETVQKIIEEIQEEKPQSSVLILGRYGFDGYNLSKSELFEYQERRGRVISKTPTDLDLEYMTVHRSKGLGYDNVIIINAKDDLYGFPSQIENDPVLKYVVKTDHSYAYAEERRLFYVALTRTKNRVYIVTPQQRPSEFVRELIADYGIVELRGVLDERTRITTVSNYCPICGYPLLRRYKENYGLKIWMCTNEPEICDFITNDLYGGVLSIIKCPDCDGYLIVKRKSAIDKPFLGCTNYRRDGKGCNRTMTIEQYMQKFGHGQ